MEPNAQDIPPYYSCEWLEGGLAFNRRSLHTCLVVHHGRGFPFLSDHDGGEIDIAKILAARQKIVDVNRSGEIHSACQGCTHLVKKPWPEKEYDVDIIGIAHFSHCNIKCSYCFLQTQDRSSFAAGFKPYRIAEQLDLLYQNGHLSPTTTIDWGGGEPSVYREFDRITDMTLHRGSFHYLHTNGVRFPEFLANHPHAHAVHVICSVDAGRRDTYIKLKARDYLEQVWLTLEKYITAGCTVTIKYIAKEENCSLADIKPFVKRARQIGAHSLIIDIDYNVPDSNPEVLEGLYQLYNRGRSAGLHVEYGFTGENFDTSGATANKLAARIRAHEVRTAMTSKLKRLIPGVMKNSLRKLLTP